MPETLFAKTAIPRDRSSMHRMQVDAHGEPFAPPSSAQAVLQARIRAALQLNWLCPTALQASDPPTLPPEVPPNPVTPEPPAHPVTPPPSENPVPVREPPEVKPPVAAFCFW